MLKITTYSRQDLMEIFNTDRIDSIKRSLTRLGYGYYTEGRAADLKITITQIPDAFKMYCINELGIPPQSDFLLLRNFFYYFFCDEEFALLSANKMAEKMKEEGKPICRQTINKWIDFLQKKGLLHVSKCDYVYCVSFSTGVREYTEEITKEQYLAAWAIYWNIRNKGGTYEEAFKAMCALHGGTVYKKPKIDQNAFYKQKIDNLIDIILESLEQEKNKRAQYAPIEKDFHSQWYS